MIRTDHRLIIGDAQNLEEIKDSSVDLVVTSPPYPMIEMWDETFALQNSEIENLLRNNQSSRAFELMHRELDKAWDEAIRVLRKGGIACINIGDATRTNDGLFQLFTNHSRVIQHFIQNELVALPSIIWRKQTNAPNKFMGSGMLPPGGYVTLEHEYILIFRKGGKREFEAPAQKQIRRDSAYFWEERNIWFSDVWEDLKGVNQRLVNSKTRDRSAAYPFELAHRLINMFSIKGDTVLDPFLGTGTTMLAAMGNQRNSIGVEIDKNFKQMIRGQFDNIVEYSNEIIKNRLGDHLKFTKKRIESGKEIKYKNVHYEFPVVTRQEVKLQLNPLKQVKENHDSDYTVFYKEGGKVDLNSNTPPRIEFPK